MRKYDKRPKRYPMVFFLGLFMTAPALHAEVRYEGKALRDPFAEPGGDKAFKIAAKTGAGKGTEPLALQGILYGPEHPHAIISGKIYTLDDKVGDWKVTRMEKDKVVLSQDGKEYILKLTPRKTSR